MQDSSGNALFIILIAIAMFAAFSYAVRSGLESDISDTTTEKAILATGATDECASAISAGIALLQSRNECSTAEISYELPDGTNVNALAPTDKSCHLFHPAGAGLVPCGSYIP